MADVNKIILADGQTLSIKDIYSRNLLPSSDFADLLTNNPYIHNAIPRCKDIQEYFDDGSLYTRISSGTFEDLYIGDYFKAKYNGTEKTFRLAGFNTFWINTSTTSYGVIDKNHAVVVPDECLKTSSMYTASSSSTVVGQISNGGYGKSVVHSTSIGSITSNAGVGNINLNLYTIFGSHLISSRESLSISVSTSILSGAGDGLYGASNNCTTYICQAVVMPELEVYGTTLASSSYYDNQSNHAQLPLFRLIPWMKNITRDDWWLRDVASSDSFCMVSRYGNASRATADEVKGIRPRFCIG